MGVAEREEELTNWKQRRDPWGRRAAFYVAMALSPSWFWDCCFTPRSTCRLVRAILIEAVSNIATRLRSLDVALQQLTRSPNIEQRDRSLLEEAQHACDVATDLLHTNRAMQAKYACFYGEACVALIQSDLSSAEKLRRILREDVARAGNAEASIAS